ncbi:MAG: hypothetical protein OEZ28_11855 [Nitrospinota bacterium]|nr:hypothetical protein [Nitrospinota bacterium]
MFQPFQVILHTLFLGGVLGQNGFCNAKGGSGEKHQAKDKKGRTKQPLAKTTQGVIHEHGNIYLNKNRIKK